MQPGLHRCPLVCQTLVTERSDDPNSLIKACVRIIRCHAEFAVQRARASGGPVCLLTAAVMGTLRFRARFHGWNREGDLVALTPGTCNQGQDTRLSLAARSDGELPSLAQGNRFIEFWVTVP